MSESEQQARQIAHWQVLAFRARSFRWAAAFLSRAQRQRVVALYAFCRAVDDLADAEWVTPEARKDLDRMRVALAAEPAGESLWPQSYLWFRNLCLECGIDLSVVGELLNGMTSDLGVVRLQTDRELVRYCYRVAGTVGLMMCSVLGVRDPRAWRHAIDLGIAMQLTNISRDVLEDAQASRVYLPADRLSAYGVGPDDLIRGEADPQAVSLVVDEVLVMADAYYRSADEGMRFLPARARWAILVASRLYQGIGRRLRRRYQCNPMLGRVVVPWSRKLALVAGPTVACMRLAIKPPRAPHRKQVGEYLDGLPYAGS
ncbi:MAG: phytoene/squalene synthase family protein [Myxococcales bacterium]|nr:MAG: phytoene/squalene synthase family protein [Myxococcales bacterium]